MPAAFSGFSRDLFQFLGELSLNNNKKWFDANKARYESRVRGPALEFIAAMGPKLKRVSPHFVADDRKVGGSLMRIHRDVRFSKDKSPYKTNVGIHFRHDAGKDVHAPGIYVHIDTETCFVGVGIWRPDPPALAAIRDAIMADPAGWKRATTNKKFADGYTLDGESLKRPPKGFPPDHPHIDALKRKDHIASNRIKVKSLTGKNAVGELVGTFVVAKPYLKFICGALDLSF